MLNSLGGDAFKRLIRSVWLFPAVLAVILLGLTVFRLSGTSAGAYHQIIYGNTKDPDLIMGHPQPIRSDEWLAVTQLTIAQSKAGYPRVNSNIGDGTDMSLIDNTPYKDWSAAFKPENLSFFILPLENAFAFKWWFMLYLLIVGSYFFTLRYFRKKRLFAALFSLAIGFSPFVFWWYQTATIMPLAYGFFILLIGMRIIDDERVSFLRQKQLLYSRLIQALVLTYLLVAFALVLYPPFQIPIATGICIFLLGYLLDAKFDIKLSWPQIRRRLAVLTVGLVLAVAFLGLFLATRQSAIKAVTGTVYPGARISTSGHLNSLNVFDSFMMPQLQSEIRGTHFFNNQSEASNFIMLAPFLVIPCLGLIVYEYFKKRRIDWVFVMIQVGVLLFLARMFVPFGDRFYNLLQFDRVPNQRLVVGLGFIGFLQIVLLLSKLLEFKIRPKMLWTNATLYCLVCFAILLNIGFHTSHLYPLFISYWPKIVGLAAVFSLIIFLLLSKRQLLFVSFFLIFSLVSVFDIHPLYRGLGWIDNNQLFARMQADSLPTDKWATTDNLVFENLALLADRPSASGVQPYPDLKFWQQINEPGASDVYNRFAHTLFISNPPFSSQLHLVQPDFYEIGLRCSPFVTKNINYVLDTSQLNLPCLSVKDKVVYPAATFYIYKVNQLSQ